MGPVEPAACSLDERALGWDLLAPPTATPAALASAAQRAPNAASSPPLCDGLGKALMEARQAPRDPSRSRSVDWRMIDTLNHGARVLLDETLVANGVPDHVRACFADQVKNRPDAVMLLWGAERAMTRGVVRRFAPKHSAAARRTPRCLPRRRGRERRPGHRGGSRRRSAQSSRASPSGDSDSSEPGEARLGAQCRRRAA
jgi:hypothetical protein